METPSSAFAKLLCVLLKGEKSIPAFNEPHKKQKADTERSIIYARSINFSFFFAATHTCGDRRKFSHDLVRIPSGSDENLGRPVPPGGHVVGEVAIAHWRVGELVERACQPKVSHFARAVGVDQNV
jgi:hypothetical protein